MTEDSNRDHSSDSCGNETQGLMGPRGIRGLRLLQAALLVFSAALIAHGILNGSMNDVLAKAVRICTECIGLG